MNKEAAFYFTENHSEEYIHYWQRILEPQGWKMIPFHQQDLKSYSALLLFSPAWWHERLVSHDLLWKNFLAIKAPSIKLITIGTSRVNHPNYIDTIHPPEKFGEFMQTALPAKEAWTPIDTGGLDLTNKLHRFLEGHGSDSIRQIFTPINRLLTIVSDELKQGTSFTELKKEIIDSGNLDEKWHIFRSRFTNYYPFFGCLPFFDLFRKINISVKKIHPFFQTDYNNPEHFASSEWITEIKNINLLLSEIETYA